jgi:hypothetical protein
MEHFLTLFLNTAMSGFWPFVGCMILLSVPLNFVFILVNRFLRHWNIRKHGYPPAHCDADGDFKPTPIEVEL